MYRLKLELDGYRVVMAKDGDVKVPLSGNADLLFTVAYRYQKIKSVVRQPMVYYDTMIYDTYSSNGQFNEWTHKENLNRLSFGIAIMFR
jgi:hypothetical protein